MADPTPAPADETPDRRYLATLASAAEELTTRPGASDHGLDLAAVVVDLIDHVRDLQRAVQDTPQPEPCPHRFAAQPCRLREGHDGAHEAERAGWTRPVQWRSPDDTPAATVPTPDPQSVAADPDVAAAVAELHTIRARMADTEPAPADVLTEVRAERARQDAQWGQQDHPNGTGLVGARAIADRLRAACATAAADGTATWAGILTEEVAEALAEHEPHLLRAELVQVAAVAAAWIEALDRAPASTVPPADDLRARAEQAAQAAYSAWHAAEQGPLDGHPDGPAWLTAVEAALDVAIPPVPPTDGGKETDVEPPRFAHWVWATRLAGQPSTTRPHADEQAARRYRRMHPRTEVVRWLVTPMERSTPIGETQVVVPVSTEGDGGPALDGHVGPGTR